MVWTLGATPLVWRKRVQHNNLISAFAKGNVEVIATYLDTEEIDLTILAVEDVFDKAAAKKQLMAFFKRYPAVSFESMHEGQSKGTKAQYLIGTLRTESRVFKVNIALKNGLIQSIIIS